MGATLLIALFWIAFAGTHIMLSGPNVRPRLVESLGEQVYKGLYSLVAFATFVPLVWIFSTHKRAGPSLWTTLGPPLVVEALGYVLVGLALVLLVCSLLPGSAPPSSMLASGPAAASGIIRITRHPTFAAFALFGLAHLLANGNLGDVIFFGGFPLFAWFGARHQDERKARERSGYRELMATTSIVPFAAIAAGRQRLLWGELPLAGVTVGVVLTVVVRAFHGSLFGP